MASKSRSKQSVEDDEDTKVTPVGLSPGEICVIETPGGVVGLRLNSIGESSGRAFLTIITVSGTTITTCEKALGTLIDAANGVR